MPMTPIQRYLVVAGLLLVGGAVGLVAAYLEAAFAFRKQTAPPSPAIKTIVWRDEHCRFLMNSFTGTVEGFDDWHIWMTNEDGYCCLVDARDIVEVW